MSHVTTIKTEIKDLGSLKQACIKLGLELVENKRTYKSWSSGLKCDHAIRVPGNSKSYEIGVTEKDGVFNLSLDAHAGGYGLIKLCGKKASSLVEAYTQTVAITEATKFAQSNGWSVVTEYDSESEETVIKLRKY